MTPTEIAELSEEEARAQFRAYRFAANDGEPWCNRCGCLAAWTYKDGAKFKCKGCLKQFTLTTNTPFSSRKLPFKTILGILAEFNIAYQGRSALEIRRNLRRRIKNYKTVFVWLHKIRLALKKQEQSRVLSGEIEIDGKEMGGYIRPTNSRSEKNGHWKFPFRAADRKLWVCLARERNGGARSWIGRSEEDPVLRFMDAVAPGSVVYADGGNWGDIRDRFKLRQVIHEHHFYTPESCTNNAESGFNVLGTLERILGHVSGTYLDLYAAQLAWRLTRIKMSDMMASMI